MAVVAREKKDGANGMAMEGEYDRAKMGHVGIEMRGERQRCKPHHHVQKSYPVCEEMASPFKLLKKSNSYLCCVIIVFCL